MYHFTRTSSNRKTGPIPVTTSTRAHCSPSCPFYGAGCYAEGGPLALHWREVTEGRRGGTWAELCDQVARLPRGQLWRHNQAGDLPHSRGRIRARMLQELTRANRGKRGWTYTHHKPTPSNVAAVAQANAGGFVVNWSANSLAHADELAELVGDTAPVAVVLPEQLDRSRHPSSPKVTFTPQGRRVVTCPATYRDTSCAECGLCAQGPGRGFLVGFPAHGSGARKADMVARGLPVVP